jgi:hypothetical protein
VKPSVTIQVIVFPDSLMRFKTQTIGRTIGVVAASLGIPSTWDTRGLEVACLQEMVERARVVHDLIYAGVGQ